LYILQLILSVILTLKLLLLLLLSKHRRTNEQTDRYLRVTNAQTYGQHHCAL